MLSVILSSRKTGERGGYLLHETVSYLHHGVHAALAVQDLVAHRVAADVVAHDVLRVPVVAAHALDVDRELREIEQGKIRLELVRELREAAIPV